MENTVEYNENKRLFLNSISNIKKKNDGSFIVNYNNMPYHISNSDEMLEKYNWLTEYIEKYPEQAEDYIEKQYIPSAEEKVEHIRNKRNSLLNEADIILMKYQEQVSLNIIQVNDEYYNALLQYKQNLRDITKQLEFPNNVIFPVLPEYA